MTQVSPEIGAPSLPWTGPIHLDLLDAQGWAAGTAELNVSVDTLTLRFGGRTLAYMVRSFFRSWLLRPGGPYFIDDVIWSVQGSALCIEVDGRLFYSPQGDAIEVLRNLL
jgi:hypothetical protein